MPVVVVSGMSVFPVSKVVCSIVLRGVFSSYFLLGDGSSSQDVHIQSISIYMYIVCVCVCNYTVCARNTYYENLLVLGILSSVLLYVGCFGL